MFLDKGKKPMIGITQKVVPPVVNLNDTNKKTIPVEQHETSAPFSDHQLQLDDPVKSVIFRPLPSQKEVALKQIIVDDAVTAKRNWEMRELKRVAASSTYAKNLAYAEIICKKVRAFAPLRVHGRGLNKRRHINWNN